MTEPEQPSTPRARMQFFQEDAENDSTESESHPSLRSYLAERLRQQRAEQARAEAPLPKPTPQAGTPFILTEDVWQRMPWAQAQREGLHGCQLNGLDTELTAGFEQYLKTPTLRVSVMKQRVEQEIRSLAQQLDRYCRLSQPSPKTEEKISLLEHKLALLQFHNRELDAAIETQLQRAPWLVRTGNRLLQGIQTGLELFWRSLGRGLQWVSLRSWLDILRPSQTRVRELNHELAEVQALLASQAYPEMPASEMADLIHRYDTLLNKMTPWAESLEHPPSRIQRCRGWIRQLIRRLTAQKLPG